MMISFMFIYFNVLSNWIRLNFVLNVNEFARLRPVSSDGGFFQTVRTGGVGLVLSGNSGNDGDYCWRQRVIGGACPPLTAGTKGWGRGEHGPPSRTNPPLPHPQDPPSSPSALELGHKEESRFPTKPGPWTLLLAYFLYLYFIHLILRFRSFNSFLFSR